MSPDPMVPVKVGVIGIGNMGWHHARVLSLLKDADLVGVADPDEDRGVWPPSSSAVVGSRTTARCFRRWRRSASPFRPCCIIRSGWPASMQACMC